MLTENRTYMTIDFLPQQYEQFKQELRNASLASQVQTVLNLSLDDALVVLQCVPSWKYYESYSGKDLQCYFKTLRTFAVAHLAKAIGCSYYHTNWENPHPAHEQGKVLVQAFFGSDYDSSEYVNMVTSDLPVSPLVQDAPCQVPCAFVRAGNCYYAAHCRRRCLFKYEEMSEDEINEVITTFLSGMPP